MKEVTLPTGAILGLQMADFEDGTALYQTLCSELVGVQMPVSIQGQDIQSLAGMNINELKDGLLKMLGSPKIYAAIWKCMMVCTYTPANSSSPVRITKNTFQEASTRKDFLPVAWEVLSFNVGPFFESLTSMLLTPNPRQNNTT
jgi:hypothetical protein